MTTQRKRRKQQQRSADELERSSYRTEDGYLRCTECGGSSFRVGIPRHFIVVDQINELTCIHCGLDAS